MTKNGATIRRETLSYLLDVVQGYDSKKRIVKHEAMIEANRKLESERRELARFIWEAKQAKDVTISDIVAASSLSRPTVYRLIEEHIANSGGEPGLIAELAKNAKMQKRFEYVGVEREEIVVLDTVTGKTSPLYIDNWKHEWYYHVLSARRGSEEWDAVPELDLLVSMVENGEFVPVEDVAKLARPIRERIAGAESIAASTPVKNEPSFDDWDM